MKKLVFVLGLCLLLSGCGNNKVVCSGSVDEQGLKVKLEVSAALKDDKVNEVSASMTFDDEKAAKQYCGLMELANSFAEDDSKKIDFECSGKSIEFKDYTKLMDSDEKIKEMTKDQFIEVMEAEKLTCK